MSSLKDVTIFVFEAAWTDTFKEEEGFLPQASILPYVQALAENSGCSVIYRQIRTPEDFRTWSKAIKNSQSGKRIVWIAGHGQKEGVEGKSNFQVQIRMPDYKKTNKGNRLVPKEILNWLRRSGAIDGLIVDSCNFGKNEPDKWIPHCTMWALAYRSSVNWTESVFFGIKTLEWLYERHQHPKNSLNAKEIFEKGIMTGGYQRKDEQFSLLDFGMSLKASFYYKKQGSRSWQCMNAEELNDNVS